MRKQWRRDFYEKELSPATLRAIEETKQIIAHWLKFHEENEDD